MADVLVYHYILCPFAMTELKSYRAGHLKCFERVSLIFITVTAVLCLHSLVSLFVFL